MIDGARRFAVRWLLEPTEQEKEYTYEYNFKLAIFHMDAVTFKRYDETYRYKYSDTYRCYVNSSEYTEWTVSPEIIVPQAKIYRIDPTNNAKEYLGMVEYLMCGNSAEDYEFADYSTGESESKRQHILFPGPVDYGVNYYQHMTIKDFIMLTDYVTGNTLYKYEDMHPYPSEPVTGLQITDNTTWEYRSRYKYIRIKGLSRPAWESKSYITIEDENGITTKTIDRESQTASDGEEYSFYPGMSRKYVNYYEYQDKFFIMTDTPTYIDYAVKCSDGLDYDSFVKLCDLTSDFSQKTTINIERD